MRNKSIKFGLLALLLLLVLTVGGLFALGRVHFATPPKEMPDKFADLLVVEKKQRKITAYRQGIVLATYQIGLGANPLGHKLQEGDNRTPEGKYKISYKNPTSRYHLSLRVSYPNKQDKQNALNRGVSAGSDIMIHGYPNLVPNIIGDLILKGKDWTRGCIAVSNQEIEHLWQIVPIGTTIELRP